MSIQILTRTAIRCNFVVTTPPAHPAHSKSIRATSFDYGFDFDEEELGRQLLASLPACLAIQPDIQVGADEFESLYRWFN